MKFYILLVCAFLPGIAPGQQKAFGPFLSVHNVVVRLEGSSGDFEVEASRTQELFVQLETFFRNGAAPEFSVEHHGDSVVVFQRSRPASVQGRRPQWRIVVPDGCELLIRVGAGSLTATSVGSNIDFSTGNGYVEATSWSGNLAARSGKGDINVNVGGGALTLHTGSGTIRVKEAALQRSSTIITSKGDVIISLAGSPGGDLDVTSDKGDVRIDYRGSPIAGSVKVMLGNKSSIDTSIAFDRTELVPVPESHETWTAKSVRKGDSSGSLVVRVAKGTARLIE